MGTALQSELFRLVRRPLTRSLFLLPAMCVAALYLVIWLMTRSQPGRAGTESLRIDAVPDTGMFLVFQFGTVSVVIQAASSIGSEFSWETILAILPHTSTRSAFLSAKLLSLAMFAIAVDMLGFLSSLGASTLVTSQAGLDYRIDSGFVCRSVASLGRTTFVMLPYLALAFLAALWAKSTGMGIGTAMAVLSLEGPIDSILGTANIQPARFLLGDNAHALLSANAGSGVTFSTGAETFNNPWQAAGVLSVYILLFGMLAYWRFSSVDTTAP